MRIARVTYKGAYHHVMNRGIGNEDIFPDDITKKYFLKIIKEKTKILKTKLFAYCIMDNHYHLILQNSSGRLSEFMKRVNGQYGIYYRNRCGGKGYVFQGRFKSTLIQEDKYLAVVIVYLLLNPVNAGIVENQYEYKWSSIHEYFVGENSDIIDNEFVEVIYRNKKEMNKLLNEWSGKDITIRKTRIGYIIGDDDFILEAHKKYDRRKGKGETRRMRINDYIFASAPELIKQFEEEKNIKISKIDVTTKKGKKLRSELLVILKDKAGLKYTDIMKYPIFKSLKYSSLGQIYKRVKSEN
jgi:REP element-mobilizing transposase RayT